MKGVRNVGECGYKGFLKELKEGPYQGFCGKQLSRKNAIPKVLLVEDNPEDVKQVERCLEGEFQMVCVDSLKKAGAKLGKEKFEIVLLNLMLPNSDDLRTLARVREMAPDVPIVVITAAEGRKMAVQAVRQGG